MARHKRKGPKSTRAGCLLCKSHKRQCNKHERPVGEKKLTQRERYPVEDSDGRP